MSVLPLTHPRPLQPHIPLGMMMVFNVRPSAHPPIPETVPTQVPTPMPSVDLCRHPLAESVCEYFDSVRRSLPSGCGQWTPGCGFCSVGCVLMVMTAAGGRGGGNLATALVRSAQSVR